MGSDVLYESKHPSDVAKGLIRFLKPGGKILLSDPGRSYLQQFVHAMNNEGYVEEMAATNAEGKEIFIFLFFLGLSTFLFYKVFLKEAQSCAKKIP